MLEEKLKEKEKKLKEYEEKLKSGKESFNFKPIKTLE